MRIWPQVPHVRPIWSNLQSDDATGRKKAPRSVSEVERERKGEEET